LAKHGISPRSGAWRGRTHCAVKRRAVDRALAGELTHHLGYANREAPEKADQHRNGYSKKTVVGEEGRRKSRFRGIAAEALSPFLIAKGQKRFEGFYEKIIARCARGMTGREIQCFVLNQCVFIGLTPSCAPEGDINSSKWRPFPAQFKYPTLS
jgi:putative transposase